MTEIEIGELFAPKGGWKVRILDLSGGAEDHIVEDVSGFPTLMQANAFARRYVRDSIERCRVSGATARDVLDVWFAFGEDAHALDAGEEGWKSAADLATFAETPADDEECDWRALDPRLHDDLEEEDEE
jgi:hypothetical protein